MLREKNTQEILRDFDSVMEKVTPREVPEWNKK